MFNLGSSPRVRGKLVGVGPCAVILRIIPARAGQTKRKPRGRTGLPDHPRACGANAADNATKIGNAGSSPRVRGKLFGGHGIHGEMRIIPARAGQTTSFHPPNAMSPDHPRACGANRTATTNEDVVIGSSPRVRGKRADVRRICAQGRGSSPRVRGKLCGKQVGRCRVRIIPARAGQTRWPGSRRCAPTDHPRACGANKTGIHLASYQVGSSPRVRGKLIAVRGQCLRPRIIPARAGQTSTSLRGIRPSQDHPRACGANAVNWPNFAFAFGSSPRVRGKLIDSSRIELSFRIIPARAGQTSFRVARW